MGVLVDTHTDSPTLEVGLQVTPEFWDRSRTRGKSRLNSEENSDGNASPDGLSGLWRSVCVLLVVDVGVQQLCVDEDL